MGYFIGGLIALALAGVAVALLALRQSLKKASPVEGELRERITDLEAEGEALRGRLAEAERGRTAAETRLEAEQKNLAEQRRIIEEAEARLKDAFKALSADALKDSREQFLSTAAQRLAPIQDLLADYQRRLGEVEKAREGAYSGLREYLDALKASQQSLQKETQVLSTALKSPTARGRWGEVTLRRVVELAGMSPRCDFDEQASLNTDEGRLRPDLTVHLPGDRLIVVDSKVPGAAYFEAIEAPDEASRRAALARHAQAVRGRMRELGQKAYASHFKKAPDFVVLFLSPESFFSAALQQEPSLIEEGMASGVVFATPTTMLALLKAVQYGWRQQELAENAERIAQAGQDLYERLRVFLGYFGRVGDGLGRALDAYNQAVGSYERRLEPGVRRLAELGAGGEKEIEPAAPLDGTVRSLPAGAAAEETGEAAGA